MKKLKYSEVREVEIEYEELRPRVQYKNILREETDWVPEEKYSPPTVNGLLSDEHRNRS